MFCLQTCFSCHTFNISLCCCTLWIFMCLKGFLIFLWHIFFKWLFLFWCQLNIPPCTNLLCLYQPYGLIIGGFMWHIEHNGLLGFLPELFFSLSKTLHSTYCLFRSCLPWYYYSLDTVLTVVIDFILYHLFFIEYILLIHNYHRLQFTLIFSSWLLSQYCGNDKKPSARTTVDVFKP